MVATTPDLFGWEPPARDEVSADQIAAALSITVDGVYKRARRNGWPGRKAGKAHSWLYDVNALPNDIQKALRIQRYKALASDQNQVATLVDDGVKEAAAAAPMSISEEGHIRRDVRLAILALFDRFCAETGQRGKPARIAFTQLYNQPGALAVPDWMRAGKATVSPNSIANWDKTRDVGHINALGGAYSAARKGTSVFDLSGEIHAHITAGILKGRRISARDLRDELAMVFGELVEVVLPISGEIGQKPLPTTRSLERWIANWISENKELVVRETDPDRWRSGYRVAVGDLYGWVKAPNQLWEIDASPADLLLTDGRYSLYVLLDIYTRRIMILVTKTPRTEAALLLLKRGIETWGKPHMVRTDRGSDFVSADAKRFFALLRIIHDECDAYNPQQKGGVERHVKTVQHSFITQLPGFVGHNVAERKVIEARKSFDQRLGQSERDAFEVALTRDDLQAKIDDWCEYVYAQRPHDGLKGKTPWAMANDYTGEIVRIDDPARIGMLLAPAPKGTEGRNGIRTVTKKGIRVENAHFWDEALVLFMRKPVFVRMDPHDMGLIWVFTEDHSEFICKAINVEREGINREELAQAGKMLQKDYLADLRAKYRAGRRGFKPHALVDRKIMEAKAQATKVITFARPSTTTSTPALDAIGIAQTAGQAITSKPVSAAEAARTARIAAELSKPADIVPLNTKSQQFARAVELERQEAEGVELSDADAKWLKIFRNGPVYRSRMRVAEDHGLEAALAI